jgi:hypothetical protein
MLLGLCSSTVVPPISQPAAFLAWGFLGKPFPSPQKPQKDCHRSSEERKTEEAYSYIIDQNIDDRRLDLASYIFKFPTSPPLEPNLGVARRLTLPSFILLANRQTTVYFRATQTRPRIGYGTACLQQLQELHSSRRVRSELIQITDEMAEQEARLHTRTGCRLIIEAVYFQSQLL